MNGEGLCPFETTVTKKTFHGDVIDIVQRRQCIKEKCELWVLSKEIFGYINAPDTPSDIISAHCGLLKE